MTFTSSEPVAADASAETLVRLAGATKRYRGVTAIEGVNFTVHRGEVHAIVGENGAGKSTLCKVLAGVVELDEGTLQVNGQKVAFRRPSEALAAGIAMVYQETSLVPTMTVAQNLELGQEKLFTRFRSLNISAQQLLQSVNFKVDPTALVSTLGAAKKQMVEIARALRINASTVIFDEPTASLTPEEIMQLFYMIEDLKRAGVGIIFVSHALEEALHIADTVTVMRDGVVQWTRPNVGLTREDIVRGMVGRDLAGTAFRRSGQSTTHAHRRKTLVVDNLTMGTVVKNMSFSAYAGEVLGIAGLIGAGRTETAKIVAGALKRNRIDGGTITLEGKPVRYRVPEQAVSDGIAYVTEDRKLNGFFETMSVENNIYLGHLARRAKLWQLLSSRRSKKIAREYIEQLKIRSVNTGAKVVELSGGNQQKVVVAKSLVQEPRVVIFDEPTRGVDVGAIEEIHALIRSLATEGKTVILISSYLPEILSVSDRILVARQGRVVAEFDPTAVTEEQLMFAAVH
jgi:ABC-type sugar transport system ATPase subunit